MILTVDKHYIESLNAPEAEDSSYDSEGDLEETGSHHDVSRTSSDTLGQEFAEYVSTCSVQDRPPGYTARVEFALKLGYTERLVQAAMARLGPAPAQNELLAELIKLGAHAPRMSANCESEQITASDPLPLESTLEERLRPIVIDGSNVAMSHGNKEMFSCRGIRLCVDWFRSRGHREVTVFVPKWRKESPRPDNPIRDQEILSELERERMLVFTPSRLVGGKRMVCYDDRYILKLASEIDGIVVSNDNYRDLAQESPEFRKVVEERILMFSFVNDRFMPPDDPLGRSGPTLDNFLRIQPRKGDAPPPCPYGKKCTYGNKCKFHHPERGSLPHKSVTERLSEHAARHLQARQDRNPALKLQGKSLSLPLSDDSDPRTRKLPLGRTRSNVPESSYSKVDDNHSRASTYMENVNYCTQQPHKSHSIENISGEYSVPHPPPNTPYALWGRSQEQETVDSSNLHRKLQRQLTLNPSYDPRLYHMQRIQQHHRPLAPTMSNPQTLYPGNVSWDRGLSHQNVTRIASAPDSARPWNTGPPPASDSEPHINLWPPRQGPIMPNLAQDARRRLHYHLASIFPEEQVQTAMQLYPDETNPQNICAAILNMFPKP